MDPRRGLQQEYGRSRGGDGGGYVPLPSSSGRAIPPTAIPSLSTGQGFYTVESLQGATMVPPPQPAPPAPRLLPPPEPYPRDLAPPRHSHRLHPAERGDFAPFDRRYPPPAAVGRKMMMPPPPEFPLPHRAEGMRGHGMRHHHPPPPFMGDPRMPGFFPGRREPPLRGGWGDFDRHLPDRNRDHSRPSERIRPRKQGPKTAKPASSQAKSPTKAAAAEKRSSADKKNSVEGGPGWCASCKIDCLKPEGLKKHLAGKRHKKHLQSQMEVENLIDKAEEVKNKGDGITAVAVENTAEKTIDKEVGETIAGKEGKLAHKSADEMVVDEAEGEGKNELTKPAATPKPVTSVAGKKRPPKEVAPQKKKPRKSAASADAINATSAIAVKGTEDASNVSEAVETCNVACANEAMLDTHTKGADHVSPIKKSSLKAEGDGKDAPASGENLSSVEEIPEGSEDGSKEVRNVTDLANGKAGQSAEIQ